MQITTVGLDLAKNVFQVHGIDAGGKVVVRRRLRRAKVRDFFAGKEPCLTAPDRGGNQVKFSLQRRGRPHMTPLFLSPMVNGIRPDPKPELHFN